MDPCLPHRLYRLPQPILPKIQGMIISQADIVDIRHFENPKIVRMHTVIEYLVRPLCCLCRDSSLEMNRRSAAPDFNNDSVLPQGLVIP